MRFQNAWRTVQRAVGVMVIGCSNLALVAHGEETTPQENWFRPPVRITADGKPIDTGAAWGHSSPAFEDMNGDGAKDLVLGDFSGKFQVYRNEVTNGGFQFGKSKTLQAGSKDAEVWIYCCIGSQARFGDLDGDGIRDMISNSYDPGHCYLFRGLPNHQFAERIELVDKSGTPIRSSPVQQQNYQSFGSFYELVDWEDDGDLDVLIGCFDGTMKLRINEGSSSQYEFATDNVVVEAGGEPMKVSAHLCPVVADWDQDGNWDIVAGSDDGSVTWFRNVGSKGKPSFAAGVALVEKHDGNGYNLVRWSEEEIRPGIRSQVDVVDFNNDGKLDLIVGDFCTAYEFRTGLSDEERAEVKTLMEEAQSLGKAFAAKMTALREEFTKKYPGDAIYGEEADKEWSKAYTELREGPEAKQMEADEKAWVVRLKPYLEKTQDAGDRSFDLAKSHGCLWLFERK